MIPSGSVRVVGLGVRGRAVVLLGRLRHANVRRFRSFRGVGSLAFVLNLSKLVFKLGFERPCLCVGTQDTAAEVHQRMPESLGRSAGVRRNSFEADTTFLQSSNNSASDCLINAIYGLEDTVQWLDAQPDLEEVGFLDSVHVHDFLISLEAVVVNRAWRLRLLLR